jgi:hypothetical protein
MATDPRGEDYVAALHDLFELHEAEHGAEAEGESPLSETA